MNQGKLALKASINGLIGFIVLIIAIFIMNYIASYINEPAYVLILNFINNNLREIFLFILFLTFSDIFYVLKFPFNLPYPFLKAIANLFIIKFLVNIVQFLDLELVLGINADYNKLYLIISIVLFVLIIILGYMKIFTKLQKKTEDKTPKGEKV